MTEPEKPSLWARINAGILIFFFLPLGFFASTCGPAAIINDLKYRPGIGVFHDVEACLLFMALALSSVWHYDRVNGRAPIRYARSSTNSAALLLLTGLFVGIVIMPKFGNLILRNHEGTGLGNLGSIRSALSIYYGDMQGQYPSDLNALAVGHKYLYQLPAAKPGFWHQDSNAVLNAAKPNDAGGWFYDNVAGDPNMGTVLINCTHQDSRGKVFTEF